MTNSAVLAPCTSVTDVTDRQKDGQTE